MSDYITLDALKVTLSINSTNFDADLSTAITSASRAIDNLCNRRFWLDADANQVRYYSPASLGTLEVDDISTLTSLETDPAGDNTFPDSWTLHTDFELTPLNAAADGWPYTKVVVRPNGAFLFPSRYPRSVKVTAQFGWPSVPQPIADATTIIADKVFKRKREAPWAIVQVGMNGEAIRLSRNDPEVAALVEPYRKHRIAVA